MGGQVDRFFGVVDPKGVGVNGVLTKNWMIVEDDEDFQEASTSSESLPESSENSVASSPSDTAEDASSPSTSNSSFSGPLYELSELKLHLPGKVTVFYIAGQCEELGKFGEEGSVAVTDEEEDEVQQELRRTAEVKMVKNRWPPWLKKLHEGPVFFFPFFCTQAHKEEFFC